MSDQSRFFDSKRDSFKRQVRRAMRDVLSANLGRHKLRTGRRRLRFEGLEDRRLLALVWANRGDDSDMFDTAFGANAEVGRGVVDSALNEWNRVVTGYDGDTFDVQLTIAMDPTNAATSAFASNTVRDANGVPISGNVTINMALDGGGITQWYLDPTPDDHSEFMGALANAFARSPTPGGPAAGMRDLRTLLIHEIGHTMGVSSGSPLMYSNPAITMTNTNLTDNSVGVGTNSYWLFQGPSVNVVMTDFDIGGPVTASAGHNAMPRAGNPAINFNSQTYYTAVDTMQPTSLSTRRILLTNKVALMMKDMGYDVNMPERNGTFHTVLDHATGLLTIQGGNDNTQINSVNQGPSSDSIAIQRFGNSLFVSVDIGVDVPGSGPGLNSLDQQGVMISVFAISEVSAIHVDGFAGNDQISITGNFNFLDLLEVYGGAGNDSINASGLTGDQPLIAFGETGVDTLIGGPGADSMNGGPGNDTINGNNGNDLLVGSDGSDTISGGNGNDRIIGGELIASLIDPLSDASGDTLNGDAGEDLIIGDDGSYFPLIVRQTIGGADTIRGGLNNDLIFGGAGADNIHGQGGNDTIAAGQGNDTVIGGSLLLLGQSLQDGADFINGEEGNDFIYGDNLSPSLAPTDSLLGGSDELLGGDGNDTLVGQFGHDQMEGNDGTDIMHGGIGNDQMSGGEGNDTLIGDDGTDLMFGNSGNDELRGGNDNDILVGGPGNDKLFGDAGDDVANGEAGADTIVGGNGDDRITGGDGNDILIGGNDSAVLDFGADQIDGDAGDDWIIGDSGTRFPLDVSSIIGGPDTIQGGLGNDTIYAMAGNDFVGGGADNDTLYLGPGDDIANGDSSNDRIFGGAGNDILAGSAGEDEIHGDDGNDWLIGGNFTNTGTAVPESDDDTLFGGAGQDLMFGDSWSLAFPFAENSIGGNDTLFGDSDNDTVSGQAGNDQLRGGFGEDQLFGGDGNDSIRGETGNDTISGGRGNDEIRGDDGDDLIRGDDGNDQLYGGAGADILLGGGGTDSIFGNAGRDLLIGGRNGDRMNGNEDDDLLIAGVTNFDNNDAALREIMLEWNSVRGYLSRVANLRGTPNVTFASRLNGNTFLQKGITVFDDDEVDSLSGGAATDWFLLDKLAPLPDDVIADLQAIEVIN